MTNLQEAEKAQYAAGQVAAEQQAVAISAEEVSPPTRRQTDAAPTSMDVDSNQPGEGSAKRKAEDDILPDESKRPKMGELVLFLRCVGTLEFELLLKTRSPHHSRGTLPDFHYVDTHDLCE